MQFTFIVTFTGFPVLSPLKWGRIQTRKFTVRAVDAHRAIVAARGLLHRSQFQAAAVCVARTV